KLIDTYNRTIDYLRISVTDRCNLRCTYCMPQEGIELIRPEGILRYEEFMRISEIAVSNGITKIRVTGGEPLVRKGIVDFISNLAKIKGLKDLSLTTNGVLLKEYARPLKDAGLRRVNVSMDSLRSDRFHKITRGNKLDKVFEGLEEAERVGLTPVKINIVVIKGFNEDEILDFALLTMKKPYHVRYIEYMPFEAETGWQRDKCVTIQDIMDVITAFQKILPIEPPEQRTGPAKRYRFKNGLGEIGFISPVSEHFCGSCNRLRLTADGKLRICLFSDSEIDIRKSLRDGCSDEKIKELLFTAVKSKPEGHHINENIFKKCSKTMSLIGG
ncbi:MAG: GTP 3',8-cyclase MoaA, partial [Thermodesulfobacteriota bacterium]